MVSTSIAGSFLVILSVTLFFPLPGYNTGENVKFSDIPIMYYVYGGIWIGLAFLGFIVQVITRSKKEDDDQKINWNQNYSKKDAALWKDDFKRL